MKLIHPQVISFPLENPCQTGCRALLGHGEGETRLILILIFGFRFLIWFCFFFWNPEPSQRRETRGGLKEVETEYSPKHGPRGTNI